jgi:membrane-associated phospholipid phosphatase
MFQFGTEFQDMSATGTGFFRMYNDRHWLTDVAAGAGIGILCTKTAYWLYPKCKTTFQKRNKTSVMIAPFITEKKRELD